MFWPSTTEPSGPGGWHFGALTKSKKISSPEHTSRDCLLIRFSEISFEPSLDRAFLLTLARVQLGKNSLGETTGRRHESRRQMTFIRTLQLIRRIHAKGASPLRDALSPRTFTSSIDTSSAVSFAMSGMIVAGGLAFRAGVAPGAHRDRRAGSSRFSSRQPSRRVDDTSSTGRVRLAARADATATEAKKTDSKKQEPKKADAAKASKKETSTNATDAKKKDTSAPTNTDAKRKDFFSAKKKTSSSSAEKAEKAAEPPAPPAAPAGYEKEIKRLQKAGVETHDFGTSYLDDCLL